MATASNDGATNAPPNSVTTETSQLTVGDDDDVCTRRRNLVGFWLLGLCNNFSYVVMLSAAHDILKPTLEPKVNSSALHFEMDSKSNETDGLGCNPLSTGTILLADILPTLLIKVTAPFYMHKLSYNFRSILCVLLAFASFFMVAYSHALGLSLLGVACASASSGFGEITLLSFSAHFDKDVVSTWSSGTGAAGVFGALSYAGLISAGVSPRNTILIMNVVPVLFIISFWYILVHPEYLQGSYLINYATVHYKTEEHEQLEISKMTFSQKLVVTKGLLKYMIPLFLVYFAEYFINQGLHELIFWKDIWITPSEQYRWYQVDYQLGVLISRSSVNILPIKNICLLTGLQWVNLAVLAFESIYHFLPSVWIMFAIVFFEGLLGGAVYVNAFYRVSKEVPPSEREFCMGITSVADSTGIALAGATALPAHNALCKYWLHRVFR
ncbi:predicted protein [Nematostella vectensis]|uniref:Battenin n=1 Tax=Nematostella vectensis TaxID=45351 RepID=A7T386_NEMVE|nr:predicted protein [Nematostella vectensis]|eukprot:XP_001621677.1 hypothetical protein NEMVEDRAFT_v1g195662 [Nematostella vectensis]